MLADVFERFINTKDCVLFMAVYLYGQRIKNKFNIHHIREQSASRKGDRKEGCGVNLLPTLSPALPPLPLLPLKPEANKARC